MKTSPSINTKTAQNDSIESETESGLALEDLIERAMRIEGDDAEHSAKLGELTVDTASALLTLVRAQEPTSAKRERKHLATLLRSPAAQVFSTALTDRLHRVYSADRSVDALLSLADRSNCESELPYLDRVQIRGARLFGPMLPDITRSAMLSRIRSEAGPYLIDGREAPFTRRLKERSQTAVEVNVNYLGEEVLGEKEAIARAAQYAELLARDDVDAVSLKLSALDTHLAPIDFDGSVSRVFDKLLPLFAAAERPDGQGPLIYFDMEAYRDMDLTEAVLMKVFDCDEWLGLKLGVAVQTYLPESVALVQRLGERGVERLSRGGTAPRIRLVKGANLQMEQVESSQNRLDCPVLASKELVDAQFKRALRAGIRWARQGALNIGVASHNLFDISYALLLKRRANLRSELQFEMLEGMAGTLGDVIAEIDGSLLIYAPTVMPRHFNSAVSYLARRLDENTADENYLRHAPAIEPTGDLFDQQAERFRTALEISSSPSLATLRKQDRSAAPHSDHTENFDNVANTDWTRAANRSWVQRHLASFIEGTHAVAPQVAFKTEGHLSSSTGVLPSRPGDTYAISLLDAGGLTRAVEVAHSSLSEWNSVPLEERRSLLRKVAVALEAKRGELIAAMVFDGSKCVEEADVEISEAIDFANYYERSAADLPATLEPRGVVLIAPPWNFPLAIPLGGVFAALVCGNTALLKPAPETPLIAELASKICHESGIPQFALQMIPCADEDAPLLVGDERVRATILTGATQTARAIMRQRPEMPLFAETGGKNMAYVSDVADRELSIGDAVKSAFGHGGQKCSALSVLMLHRDVFHDPEFRSQLQDAVRSLQVGPSESPSVQVPALIHPPEGALREVIDSGEKWGTWLVKPEVKGESACQITPGVLWGIAAGSPPHLTEFFGPILAVMCVDDLHDAVERMNESEYGLTAGLFSLDEEEQETFALAVEAGNLYINRSTTGAVVARQPFGGRKASCFGAGAKAGGPDYLRQMMVPVGASSKPGNWREDFEQAMQSHFGQLHPGTKVVGEENWYLYEPAETALVFCGSVEVFDEEASRYAQKLSRTDAPVYVYTPNETGGATSAAESDAVEAFVDDRLLVEDWARRGIRRVRAVGSERARLAPLCAEAGISYLGDAVSDDGRKEVAPFLSCRAVSFAVHRHGNTSFAHLSRLGEVLHAHAARLLPRSS